MSRWRSALGMAVAVMLILSSAAHSLLGWKALREQLEKTNASTGLVTSLEIGWYWGGAAILTFGVLVIVAFGEHMGDPRVWLQSMLILGVAYAALASGQSSEARACSF